MDVVHALIGLAVIVFCIWWWRWAKKQGKAEPEPDAEPEYEGPKVMEARKHGRCIECGKAIKPGDVIAWREAEGARHMKCEHPEADNPGPETEWS